MADWGSIPAWIGLGGVLLAATSYVLGRHDARREQAARVFALTGWQYGDETAGRPNRTTIAVENCNEVPVFDVSVELRDWGRRRTWWRLRPRRERWTTGRIAGCNFPTVRGKVVSSEVELAGLGHRPGPGDSFRPPVILYFKDGVGRRWVRWPDGRLNSTTFARRA